MNALETSSIIFACIWSNNGTAPSQAGSEVLFDQLQELVPRSDAQRTLQTQAASIISREHREEISGRRIAPARAIIPTK